MKIFEFKTTKEKRQEVTEWLEKPSEEVFVWLPRICEDGSVRAFETLKRKTGAYFGKTQVTNLAEFRRESISHSDLVGRVQKIYVYEKPLNTK